MTERSFPLLDWIVIGAGPAGIAAAGKLIDQGIPPEKIGWMDPQFSVGDLGEKWSRVPSNTTVQLFFDFLQGSAAFELKKHPAKFPIEDLNPKETCLLQEMVTPLQWVTDNLKKKVHAIQDIALALNFGESKWEIKTKKHSFFAKNVILAIGSEPKSLPLTGPEIISLETALDAEKLVTTIDRNDTVGVFGSSHSAILVLANLLKLPLKQVINFYRSPQRYAVYLEDWILYDDTGLKGFTAQWAKQNLEKKLPEKLKRVLYSDRTFRESFALCTKVIYGVGFERRKIPVLEQFEHLHYDDKTGIIAPGLFGLGIAFPQAQFDPLGHLEHRVGLWKFMDYLNSILPIWMKYAN